MVTQERLKELLNYDPESGLFTWKINLHGRGGSVKIGKIAGSFDSKGKKQIRIDGVLYFAHRLAFLYMEGCFPENHVDHINRNVKDNSWKNLRHATIKENMMNRIFKRDLPRGVYMNKYKTIYSCIIIDGKYKYLGSFKTIKEAHEAYIQALSAKKEFTHFVKCENILS